jgi:hypothetical protein
VIHRKVPKRKTGSKDRNSEWAKAQVQRCLMTQEMFLAGEQLERGETTMEKFERRIC